MKSMNGNESIVIKQLKQWLYRDGVVLFLGKACDAELTAQVIELKWHCVFTSSQEQILTSRFSDGIERIARDILSPEDYHDQQQMMDRRELSVVRLCGIREDGEDSGLPLSTLQANRQRRDMLDWIRGLIGNSFNHLIVLGYSPEKDGEIREEDMYIALSRLPRNSIRFFGVTQQQWEQYEIFKTLEGENKSESFVEPLNMVLSGATEQDMDETVDSTQLFYRSCETKTIFSDGAAKELPVEWTAECRNFALVLTDEDVNTDRIYGREQLRDAFYLFLRQSATDWPQWYGYNKHHDFHLKRPYEDTLFALAKAMLGDSDVKMDGVKANVPILLCGHPGSSKSVTLGALAYRIFQEERHPVVYIRNTTLNFAADGPTYQRLNILLKHLEEIGIKEKTVLLIWDCSCYGYSQIKALNRSLRNNARKVVLVCSTYEQSKEFYDQCTWSYVFDNERFTRRDSVVDPNKCVVKCSDDFYIMCASRHLQDNEELALKTLAADYTDFDKEVLDKWWKEENQLAGNIFLRLYYLMQCLRGPLADSLQQEYAKVLKSGDLPMKEILNSETAVSLAYKAALIKAEGYEDSIIPKQSCTLQWRKMCICVALFSQFKLETPVTIALEILDPEASANYAELQWVVSTIPWLEYGATGWDENSGVFMFVYRTPLEAQLFLRENDVTVGNQVDCILEILRLIKLAYKVNGGLYEPAICAIDKLIRVIGPNTQNEELKVLDKNRYKEFQKNYPRIIEGLAILREKDGLYDVRMVTHEVTLTREYYGRLYNYHDEGQSLYDLRIRKLIDAMELARDEAKKLETKAGSTTIAGLKSKWLRDSDVLMIEHISCDGRIRQMFPDYIKQCDADGIPEEKRISFEENTLHFQDYWDRLFQAICRQPSNGFIYNAVLWLFINDYKVNPSMIIKRKNLVKVRSVIDSLEDNPTLSLIHIGEYNKNRAKVEMFSDRLKATDLVTINNIGERLASEEDGDFLRFFRNMLDQKDSSAILYIVQNELRDEHITFGRKGGLTEQNHFKVCKNLLDFLEQYSEITRSDASCAYLKLQLNWLLWNGGTPIIPHEECWWPELFDDQWKALEAMCKDYKNTFIEAQYHKTIVDYMEMLARAENYDYSGCDDIQQKIGKERFYTDNIRIGAWFIICDRDRNTSKVVPRKFSGTVIETSADGKRTGRIELNDFPKYTGGRKGIYFSMGNLGLATMPKIRESFNDLELGIGFAGFSLYRSTKGRGKR